MFTFFLVPARAYHPYADPDNAHIWSIHWSNDEIFCAEDFNTGLGDDWVQSKILSTLKYDNTNVDWHIPESERFPGGNFLVYLLMRQNICSQVSRTNGDYDATPLRYFVYPDDTQKLSDECSVFKSSVRNCEKSRGLNYARNYGHYDYHHGDIYFQKRVLDQVQQSYENTDPIVFRRWIVSHETGHAFGLRDPSLAQCNEDSDNSVMHSPDYCTGNTYKQYPWLPDRRSVNNLSDSP